VKVKKLDHIKLVNGKEGVVLYFNRKDNTIHIGLVKCEGEIDVASEDIEKVLYTNEERVKKDREMFQRNFRIIAG